MLELKSFCCSKRFEAYNFSRIFFDREKRSGSGPKNGKVVVVVVVVLGDLGHFPKIDKN